MKKPNMRWYWWVLVAIVILGTLNSIASGNRPIYGLLACLIIVAIIIKIGDRGNKK